MIIVFFGILFQSFSSLCLTLAPLDDLIMRYPEIYKESDTVAVVELIKVPTDDAADPFFTFKAIKTFKGDGTKNVIKIQKCPPASGSYCSVFAYGAGQLTTNLTYLISSSNQDLKNCKECADKSILYLNRSLIVYLTEAAPMVNWIIDSKSKSKHTFEQILKYACQWNNNKKACMSSKTCRNICSLQTWDDLKTQEPIAASPAYFELVYDNCKDILPATPPSFSYSSGNKPLELVAYEKALQSVEFKSCLAKNEADFPERRKELCKECSVPPLGKEWDDKKFYLCPGIKLPDERKKCDQKLIEEYNKLFGKDWLTTT